MDNRVFLFYLRKEYERRAMKNARYSLRAYARSLGIEHSCLIQIMKQKRKLTDQMCVKIGKTLGLSEERMKALMWHESIEGMIFADKEKIDVETVKGKVFRLIGELEFLNDSI